MYQYVNDPISVTHQKYFCAYMFVNQRI